MNTDNQIRVPVYDAQGKLKMIRMIERPAAPSMQFESLHAQLSFDGDLQMIDDSQVDQRTLPRSYQGSQGS